MKIIKKINDIKRTKLVYGEIFIIFVFLGANYVNKQ